MRKLDRNSERDIERFWSNVDIRGEDECWEWQACRTHNGYGVIGHERAHRISLELKMGRPIKAGFKSLHTCDNPPCQNPKHLFEGTSLDNNRDTVTKGRWDGYYKPGELHPHRKFGSEGRRAIAMRYDGSITMQALADEFGVSIATIHRIIQEAKRG